MHETKQIVSKSISVSSLVSALIMELKFEHSRNGPKLNYDYPVSIIFGVPINWILGRRPPPRRVEHGYVNYTDFGQNNSKRFNNKSVN